MLNLEFEEDIPLEQRQFVIDSLQSEQETIDETNGFNQECYEYN